MSFLNTFHVRYTSYFIHYLHFPAWTSKPVIIGPNHVYFLQLLRIFCCIYLPKWYIIAWHRLYVCMCLGPQKRKRYRKYTVECNHYCSIQQWWLLGHFPMMSSPLPYVSNWRRTLPAGRNDWLHFRRIRVMSHQLLIWWPRTSLQSI